MHNTDCLGSVSDRPAPPARSGLRSPAMWRIIGALALLTLLAACSSDDEAQPTDADMAEALADAGIPPEPDQATADAYIAALDAIDPRIVGRHSAEDRAGDIEAAIDRGRSQCSTIAEWPGDQPYLVSTTQQRFTSPDAPDGWPASTVEQILDVVKRYLCPTP